MKKLNKKGFTLIEVMIAVTLFSVIMVIGTGAVLNSNAIFRKTENMRVIIDNLHFVMEDISRSLRTGNAYFCGNVGGLPQYDGQTPGDCPNQASYAEIVALAQDDDPADPSDFLLYAIIPEQIGNKTVYRFEKKSKDLPPTTSPFLRMTTREVEININQSGFLVLGAGKGDKRQPRVLIRIAGTITDPRGNIVTPFNIQTTVSQRAIDS